MTLIATNLFGIPLMAGTPETATATIIEHATHGHGVVCVANVDMVTRAVSDTKLGAVMRRAFAVVTDGVPLVWALHRRGLTKAERVYGPGLMHSLCATAASNGLGIYLYGGTPQELQRLQEALRQIYPALKIAGAESPPMLPSDPPTDLALANRINASGARLVFVGLGCPKQEYWMANHADTVQAVMIGVGLAFAQIAGLKRPAPAWMSNNGLEWLFRLIQEPRRLWRRYLVGNSKFIWLLAKDILKQKSRHS